MFRPRCAVRQCPLLVGLVFLLGCSQAVSVPSYHPASTARAAFAEYDKNADGVLDAAELERCPALKSFVKKNGKSKTLTVADLEEELKSEREALLNAESRSALDEISRHDYNVRAILQELSHMGAN